MNEEREIKIWSRLRKPNHRIRNPSKKARITYQRPPKVGTNLRPERKIPTETPLGQEQSSALPESLSCLAAAAPARPSAALGREPRQAQDLQSRPARLEPGVAGRASPPSRGASIEGSGDRRRGEDFGGGGEGFGERRCRWGERGEATATADPFVFRPLSFPGNSWCFAFTLWLVRLL